ncbi:MAG: GspE/PulE family protein, partial [Lentisphaerae bacterium]
MTATNELGNDPRTTRLLNQIYQLINNAEQLQDILYEFEHLFLELLAADRFTLYRKNGNELVSWYLTGRDLDEQIRLPIGPSSIAGYVAWAMEPIRIDDVYNEDELHAIHPNLGFDYGFDQTSGYMTQSMIVVPITYDDVLLGVIQVINKVDGGTFSDQEMIHAVAIANLIGKKFRMEFRSDAGPYEYLINSGLITPEAFDKLERKAQSMQIPVTILLRREANIPATEIGKSLETYYGVPWLPYSEEFQPAPDLLEQLNTTYLAQNVWCPFRGAQGRTIVLLDDPNNADKILEIQQLLGDFNLDIRVGTQEDILRYLGYVYPEDEDPTEVNLEDIVGKLDAKQVTQDEGGGEEADLLDENASAIIQLVNHIIIEAVRIGASDIHVEPMPGKQDAVVRMRVDGECHIKLKIPYTHIRAVIARIKVLSKLDIAERRKPQDGKMAVKMEGKPLELRVATVPTVHGESAVLRVLASSTRVFTMEELNFREPVYKGIEQMLEHPHGIILVVGPTGSGKTTTLHGILNRINTPERKILTAEDPVEITQAGLQQLQVMPQIGLTFAAALRSFLRADPDVILIGEMRDFETAQIGIEASLTGHLVFSTLHTNSAPETITRLLEMDIDPLNFADALIGVLAQRLVKTLCSRCKEEYTPDAEEVKRLIHQYGEEFFPELGIDPGKIKLFRPKGCEVCMNSGYRGRTGIHELLLATPEMKHLVSKRGVVSDIRELAIKQGMRTLYQDGI